MQTSLVVEYIGIIVICGGHCMWVAKIFLVRGDKFSLVASSISNIQILNKCLYISSWRCKLVGENYLWKSLKHWSPTNNEDSTVHVKIRFSY